MSSTSPVHLVDSCGLYQVIDPLRDWMTQRWKVGGLPTLRQLIRGQTEPFGSNAVEKCDMCCLNMKTILTVKNLLIVFIALTKSYFDSDIHVPQGEDSLGIGYDHNKLTHSRSS